jgi:mono/diheme cytochrome c family protein
MLGRIAGVLVVCLVAATVALLAFSWRPRLEPIAQAPAQAKDPALIARGAELALVGNCNACHTRPGGEAFSGGVPFKTDFGTVYSTNITPDRETGIGGWSEEAFRRALHEGVGIDGRHLYPAFPYDRLTKTTDADVRAIYAFLMSRKAVGRLLPPMSLRFRSTSARSSHSGSCFTSSRRASFLILSEALSLITAPILRKAWPIAGRVTRPATGSARK